jgi:hypothetical protein
MTARSEYTAEEWALLFDAPTLVEVAVALADGSSFFETAAEGIRSGVVRYQGKVRHPGNELVAALTTPEPGDIMEDHRLPEFQEEGDSAAVAVGRLRQAAVKWCKDAMALLAERSNPEEAAGYAAWVMDVAKAAATAVRHKDGFFGAPGPVVDEPELEVLEQVARALGVDVGELLAEEADA